MPALKWQRPPGRATLRIRRLRHLPHVGAHCPPLGGRWPGGLGLGGGNRRAL